MDKELRKQMTPIFEQIGATVQSSQQMEFAIGFSLTMLKQLHSTMFTDAEFDGSMDLFSQKTLGRLIGEYKKHINLDNNAIDALKLTLDERNYIIHKFFNENLESMVTVKGREAALNRLREARNNIHPGFVVLDSIVKSLMETSDMDVNEILSEAKSSIEV